MRRKTWHKLLESDKYNLDNEPRYNSKFKQHMNYRDLYELTLKVSEELKLAYELKEMYRDFTRIVRMKKHLPDLII